MTANHTNAVFQECGFILSEEHACLGASPDMLVECNCHGQGVVDAPIIGKPGYIQESSEGLPMLQTTHSFYHQVMMQMAITKRTLCHFFVYCPQGSLMINIDYDDTLWNKLKENAVYFWEKVVAPHVHAVLHKSTSLPTQMPVTKTTLMFWS